MTESLTNELIIMLKEEFRLSMKDAMDTLYNSKTFKMIENEEAGLYYQGAVYVMEFLKSEINKEIRTDKNHHGSHIRKKERKGKNISPGFSVKHHFQCQLYVISPISLGGLGVREGTFSGLLNLYGIDTSTAIIISLLMYLIKVATGIIGYIAYLNDK